MSGVQTLCIKDLVLVVFIGFSINILSARFYLGQFSFLFGFSINLKF